MEKFDLTEWRHHPTELLIERIQHQFHESLREKLPQILSLFEKVANRHGDTSPELNEALQLYQQFIQKIPLHLLKEEQILFPLLIAQERDQQTPTLPLSAIQLTTPIMALESEHEEDLETILRIQALLKDFNPPPHACRSYRLLLESLKALKSEFLLHITIENEILFERFRTKTEP